MKNIRWVLNLYGKGQILLKFGLGGAITNGLTQFSRIEELEGRARTC